MLAAHKKEYLSFDAAREYIRKRKIPGKEAWQQYCASGNKPDNIPARPNLKYKGEGWTDWYHFLGTQKPKFLSFTETRDHVRKLRIQDTKEWNQYLKSGNKPDNIPAHPDRVYKGKDWTTWPDFLGTQTKHVSYAQAKEHAREQHFQNRSQWEQYCKSGNKPDNIPAHPDRLYKGKDWTTWPDFLGTQTKHVSYAQAKEHAREQKISSYSGWQQYCKSGNMPDNIPSHPERTYKGKDWTTWPDFLGTDNVAFKDREYLPFIEAREYVRKLKFQNRSQREQYCKSGNKPDNIPSRPDVTYG